MHYVLKKYLTKLVKSLKMKIFILTNKSTNILLLAFLLHKEHLIGK